MKITLTINTEDKSELREAKSLVTHYLGNVNSVNSMVVEDTNKVQPESEVKEEKKVVKKAPKTTKVEIEDSEATGITLAKVKESAQSAVGRTSREEVKKVIGEFAGKIAEVEETDFGKLYKKLQALGK